MLLVKTRPLRPYPELRFADLLAVPKAGNRAVAHLEDGDVDHPFRTPDDEKKRVFPVIDWTEDLTKVNMYQATARDLSIPMSHRNRYEDDGCLCICSLIISPEKTSLNIRSA